MKRKLMKMAMLYVADLLEDAFLEDDDMTVEKFISLMNITFEYSEFHSKYENRVDATLVIFDHGEVEATFTACLAR